jgi:hypothetical protein
MPGMRYSITWQEDSSILASATNRISHLWASTQRSADSKSVKSSFLTSLSSSTIAMTLALTRPAWSIPTDASARCDAAYNLAE